MWEASVHTQSWLLLVGLRRQRSSPRAGICSSPAGGLLGRAPCTRGPLVREGELPAPGSTQVQTGIVLAAQMPHP